MSLKTSFNNWSIGIKLNVVQSLALSVLFVVAIVWLTTWMTNIIVESNTERIKQINQQTLSIISTFESELEEHAVSVGKTLKGWLPPVFTLDMEQHVPLAGMAMPVLRAGGETMNMNFAVIDRFTEATGAVATIFARDGDDFVRITTSLKTENGERAIGTKLAREHPAYSRLLANQPFTGKAVLFKRDYMTNYLPVQDASGKVIAALFIGTDFTTALNGLRERIASIKIGESAYEYIVLTGAEQGKMFMHPTLEGQNMYDAKDANGFAYIRAIIEQKDGVLQYLASNGSGTQERIDVFNAFPKWDWIIVSSLSYDDMVAEAVLVRNSMILGVIVLGVLLSIVVLYTSKLWVTKPMAEAIMATEQIAKGNLAIEIPERGKDEVGQLLAATRVMTDKMRQALRNIREKAEGTSKAVEAVNTAANQVAASSVIQSSSTAAMAAAVEEMTVSINTVSSSADEAQAVAHRAGDTSREGGEIIERTATEMSAIAHSVAQASQVIKALGEASEQISSVVQVIKEVADQTNLLALNAAIEAARAGEQGRGFAVVADEVRKLAERTAQSTGDISAMVGKIQSAAKDAVAEMGHVVQQVESGKTLAHEAGERIISIREEANRVSEAVTEISKALKEQNQSSQEISRHVESVAKMTDKNNEAADEAASSSERMKQLADDVVAAVEQFRI